MPLFQDVWPLPVPSGILQRPDKAENTPRLVSLGVKFTFSDHLPQPLKMGVSAVPDYMYVASGLIAVY